MKPPKTRLDPPRFVTPHTPVNLSVRRCPVSREQASHRILIVLPGALGDIMMGSAILPALRDRYPDAHITWLAHSTALQAIEASPYVDEILLWEGMYWKRKVRTFAWLSWFRAMLAFRRELRCRDYDIFISLQADEWPSLALGSGASVKIGVFDTFRRFFGDRKTRRYTRFYDFSYAFPNLPEHRIDQYLLCLDALGIQKPDDKRITLGYTKDDRAAADRFKAESGLGENEPFVLLVPMTSWYTKCWPGDGFVALGDTLARRGHRVVLSGSPKEGESVRALAERFEVPPIIAAGQLCFRASAALIDDAALVVCGDTGPMHAAVALGTPYVALFGATSPAWYGPLAGHGTVLLHPVPCGPGDQKRCANTGDKFLLCMNLLTVEEVTDAALRLLESGVRGAAIR
ncbi:MAG: glycosyltransferase family 9 protein [Akkermansiaceae bacterium]|nr:glycosyltransferase family 9 protein [Armatimonadota bacterium]